MRSNPTKKLLVPFIALTMMSAVACGGTDDGAKPLVADQPKTALTQADLAPRVQAALLKSSTFHSVTKSTDDEDDPATYTADLRAGSAGAEVSAVGSDGNYFLR